MDDRRFSTSCRRTASLPGVRAVALGGSRAQGMQRPGSDWDFALHYRSAVDPGHPRALGRPAR